MDQSILTILIPGILTVIVGFSLRKKQGDSFIVTASNDFSQNLMTRLALTEEENRQHALEIKRLMEKDWESQKALFESAKINEENQRVIAEMQQQIKELQQQIAEQRKQ